jgi:membrane-associated protease RseP (regulator of RpoE activity)
MRSFLRTLRTLLTCYVIHEGGHAIAAALLGYQVKSFILGWGPTLISTTVWGTEWGLAPIPLGAYVTPDTTAPQWIQALAVLAGPLASFGTLLLHPWSPLRLIPPTMWRQWRMYGWDIAKYVPIRWFFAVGDYAFAKPEPEKDPGILGRLPLIDMFTRFGHWSIWQWSAALGVLNLLPIPPLDGGRFLRLLLLPESKTVDTAFGIAALIFFFIALIAYPAASITKHLLRKRNEVPT